MKIAVAMEDNRVAAHFGRCPHYALFTVEGEEIREKEVVPNPGHQPGFLPKYLAGLGVKCVITGGIGARAASLFQEQGIQVISGVSGPVEEVIKAYLRGELKDRGEICRHQHRD